VYSVRIQYGYTPGGKDNGVVKSKGKPTLHLGEGQEVVPLRARKPEWLKVRAPGGPNYLRLQKMMREQGSTRSARRRTARTSASAGRAGTATFMILGDVCTRACKYCAVAHGLPTELDLDEPRRVADSVEAMGLEHAVITSVNRDELKDGGAGHLRRNDPADPRAVPGCSVEVLIPDLRGTRTRSAWWWRRSRRSSRTTSTPSSG
jgi:lipoyl synthase